MTARGTGLGVCFAAIMVAFGASAYAQSLSAAVSNALERNAELHELQLIAAAAREGRNVSRGLAGPQVNVSASAGMNSDFTATGDSWNTRVSGSQSILDGGYSIAERGRTQFEVMSAENRLIDQSLLVSLQTVQTYLEVQRSRGMVRIMAANQARLKALQIKVASRMEAGVASAVDLYDAAAKLDAAALNLLEAKAQLADAVVNYQSLTGQRPQQLTTEIAPSASLPANDAEAVALAVKRSPRIMAVQYSALAADAAADGFAASRKPRVDLNFSAGHSDDFRNLGDSSYDLSAQVSFRFDLYDGGVGKARESQARKQAEATRHRARAAANEISREMRLSWNTIHLANERRRILMSQLKNSRQSLRLGLARFEAGVTQLAQLLDLNAQVSSAEAAWLNAEFTHRYNVYRVLAGTGRLTTALQTGRKQLAVRK